VAVLFGVRLFTCLSYDKGELIEAKRKGNHSTASRNRFAYASLLANTSSTVDSLQTVLTRSDTLNKRQP
jgi:hypothetical protein